MVCLMVTWILIVSAKYYYDARFFIQFLEAMLNILVCYVRRLCEIYTIVMLRMQAITEPDSNTVTFS